MNRWEIENGHKEFILQCNQEFFVKTSDLIKLLRKKINGQSIKIKNLQKENELLKQEIKEFDKYITVSIRKLKVINQMPTEVIYEDIEDEQIQQTKEKNEEIPMPTEVIYEDIEDEQIQQKPKMKYFEIEFKIDDKQGITCEKGKSEEDILRLSNQIVGIRGEITKSQYKERKNKYKKVYKAWKKIRNNKTIKAM